MEEPQTETITPETTESQLVESVKKQVEYYFSKENLLIDPFLTSQMDAQMCVPIHVVMKFAKLKALTQDESILRKALQDSTIVSIQDNKIKANIKPPGRSTIILREIPSDAPMEEVKEIFNFPGAKTVTSIRSEIGDTWFITMDTEDEAKDTLMDLRLKKRTFRGVAVKGRLKTETVVRSFFPVTTGITPVVPFAGLIASGMAMPVVDMRAFGYMGMPVPIMAEQGAEQAEVATPTTPATNAADKQGSPAGKTTNGASASNTAAAGNNKDARAKGQTTAATGKGAAAPAQAGRRQDTTAPAGGARNATAKGAAKDKKEETPVRPTIEITAANFPPLSGADDTPVPTPGYKDAFLKYSADEIINIAKGVKEAKLPATLNPAAHPLSMTVEPNKDLLKRQRSFSIDETREQLRQGRPVQREAILPGKVDTRSIYYGDNEPAPLAAAQPAAKKEAPAAPAAQTTPSTKKKEVSEAKAVAAELVDHVAAAAANLAITSPTASEAMHMSSPQKITPSTWAAMLKSSAAAAAPEPARPRTNSKDVKRTPAKEKAPATSGTAASASKPKAGTESKDKEAPAEGRNRRKNSEGSKGSSTAKEGGEKKGDSSSVSNSERRKTSGAEPGTPSRSSNAEKAESEATKAENAVSWGGKASFANVLKLAAENETPAPVSPVPAAAPKASAADASHRDGHKDGRREGGRDGAREGGDKDRRRAPVKPSASAVAAASSKPAPVAAGEWSTTVAKTKNSHADRAERSERPAGDRNASKSATAANPNSGANAKGAWARETLPALPVDTKVEK